MASGCRIPSMASPEKTCMGICLISYSTWATYGQTGSSLIPRRDIVQYRHRRLFGADCG